MAAPSWTVRLSTAAETDLQNILRWTTKTFGRHQADAYRDVLISAITDLAEDPFRLGSRARDEIEIGIRTLHIARRGMRGRHLLLYRVTSDERVEIARILHERMELSRYSGSETLAD